MPINSSIPDCDSISEAFLALHEQDGFSRLPPSSLLHDSVPMSFVMSAGLIQVENNLDQIIKKTGGKFTFTQPCFRHFDLNQVGNDPTRLSLFHMPAAFYIGSNQRENMLPRLWYFLTQTLKLSPEHLWISYLDDPELGRDEPTYQCWRTLGIAESHLLGQDQQQCFWRQRALGKIASDGKKCGPHTEVFYERTDITCPVCAASTTPNITCHCGRFVEISNSLFIENYLNEAGKLIPADTVFSECVVGLERLTMILQNAADVYQISRFQAWHNCLPAPDNTHTVSHNIIVDHLSAFVKLVEDGAPAPGHGGQARVMRVLARRMMTEALLIDLDIATIFTGITHPPSRNYLEREHNKFSATLKKGTKVLSELLNQGRNTLLSYERDQLQKQYGIPFLLIDKYKMQLMK
ncbi:MAG: alanine--tRNA ligase-related protein [Acidithiobacillus sp.]|nr:alanine--tRNA ligase-related protein [Acidithiobacillus sp.]